MVIRPFLAILLCLAGLTVNNGIGAPKMGKFSLKHGSGSIWRAQFASNGRYAAVPPPPPPEDGNNDRDARAARRAAAQEQEDAARRAAREQANQQQGGYWGDWN